VVGTFSEPEDRKLCVVPCAVPFNEASFWVLGQDAEIVVL
jgi:hypothetical protein